VGARGAVGGGRPRPARVKCQSEGSGAAAQIFLARSAEGGFSESTSCLMSCMRTSVCLLMSRCIQRWKNLSPDIATCILVVLITSSGSNYT
jgi:hypothetical protein